jgi:hypothetical protein
MLDKHQDLSLSAASQKANRVSALASEHIDGTIARHLAARPNIFERWLEGKVERQVRQGEADLVAGRYWGIKEALRVYNNAQIAQATAITQENVAQTKICARTETGILLSAKKREFDNRLEADTEQFMTAWDQRYKAAERIEQPQLREARIQDLWDGLADFQASKHRLRLKFADIIEDCF